jgi:hypothetical protein
MEATTGPGGGMEGVQIILVVVAFICVVCAVISAILLTRALDQYGLTTPFPLVGLFLFKNLGRYKEITRSETGKVGPLYFTYIISINTALVLVLAAVAIRFSGM